LGWAKWFCQRIQISRRVTAISSWTRWEEYSVVILGGAELQVIESNPAVVPLSYYLGCLGTSSDPLHSNIVVKTKQIRPCNKKTPTWIHADCCAFYSTARGWGKLYNFCLFILFHNESNMRWFHVVANKQKVSFQFSNQFSSQISW
jgi:hypothetical protein